MIGNLSEQSTDEDSLGQRVNARVIDGYTSSIIHFDLFQSLHFVRPNGGEIWRARCVPRPDL